MFLEVLHVEKWLRKKWDTNETRKQNKQNRSQINWTLKKRIKKTNGEIESKNWVRLGCHWAKFWKGTRKGKTQRRPNSFILFEILLRN